MKLRTFFYFYLFVSISFSAHATLKSELAAIFNQQTPEVEWSVLVQELGHDEDIFSITPKRLVVPASNMKVLVGAAGLLILGPDYTYSTELYHTGEIHNQTLYGDLIVVGSGDPSIGGRFNGGKITQIFENWAENLKSKGIQRIEGNLIGVDDVFDDVCHGLNWEPVDLIRWYAAEVSGLNLNDGCIDIQIKGASAAGGNTIYSLDPNTKYVTLDRSARTIGKNQRNIGIGFKRDPTSNTISVNGTIPVNSNRRDYVTIHNPTGFFVTVMKETLESQGIAMNGEAYDSDDLEQFPSPVEWVPVAVHTSPTFDQLVSVCLKRSQNLYAEHILKTIGAVEYGLGSYETGSIAIKNLFYNLGCDLDQIYIGDGSGLSRDNRISAESLVQVLQVMNRSIYSDIFKENMAITGVDGTLRSRMTGTAAERNVFAKTGTLKGVVALSGYIEARSGKSYAFSMISNSSNRGANYIFKNIMDKACALIAAKG